MKSVVVRVMQRLGTPETMHTDRYFKNASVICRLSAEMAACTQHVASSCVQALQPSPPFLLLPWAPSSLFYHEGIAENVYSTHTLRVFGRLLRSLICNLCQIFFEQMCFLEVRFNYKTVQMEERIGEEKEKR